MSGAFPAGTRVTVTGSFRRGQTGVVVDMPPRLANGWPVWVDLDSDPASRPLGFDADELEVAR